MKKPNKSGVYRIFNKINGKSYVGSSSHHRFRFNGHRSTLRLNNHDNKLLQEDFNNMGEDAFEFEFLEETENLIEREQFWMDQLQSYGSGYNLSPKAGDQTEFYHSDETKAKISAAKLANPSRYWLGKKRDPEMVERVAKKLKGRVLSDETKAKMSAGKIGNKNSLGVKQSPEAIAKRKATFMETIAKRKAAKASLLHPNQGQPPQSSTSPNPADQ